MRSPFTYAESYWEGRGGACRIQGHMGSVKRFIENAFESFLFNSRLVVILAVLGSLTGSVLMFVRGAVLIAQTAKHFLKHITGHDAGEELSIALISSVDSFLFATVLLIFAMGIYELFISKIDPASRTAESRPNWLQIHSLDDLKGAVGKVILMILIVRLFESAVKMKYDSPLHLLYLGLSVLFVAAALYLQHLGHKHDPKGHGDEPHDGDTKHDHGDTKPDEKPLTLVPEPHHAHAHAQAPKPAHAHAQAHAHAVAHAPMGYAHAQQGHPGHSPSIPPGMAPQGYDPYAAQRAAQAQAQGYTPAPPQAQQAQQAQAPQGYGQVPPQQRR